MLENFLFFPDYRRMKYSGILIFLSFFILCGCANQFPPEVPPSILEIKEISPNRWTRLTKQDLEHLAVVYDLKPLLFTKKINIQSGVARRSHPVLTLNTRYAENPHKLLSVFLHEQMHWWEKAHPKKTTMAVKKLKNAFPILPRKGIAHNHESTYLHLMICYLEYKAITHYLGKKEAHKIFNEFIGKEKIYPWIYTQVLSKTSLIEKIVQEEKLLPPPLK